MTAEEPVPVDVWAPLRSTTRARIGLNRAGCALATGHVLEFKVAHSQARDEVHTPLDVAALTAQASSVGIGTALHVRSAAGDRSEYLRRPDLGRTPVDLSSIPSTRPDIGFVLADGLSSRAITDHGVKLMRAVLAEFDGRYTVAPPVIATQARVALGDHIGSELAVDVVLVLIGERPGLSVTDSVGVYITHGPRPGLLDSERNCVSNIHPPDGLGYFDAAKVVASLVAGARRLGRSGVSLKDTSRNDSAVAGPQPAARLEPPPAFQP